MAIKLTNEEFLKKLSLVHGNKYTPLDSYVNTHEKITVKCNACSNIWKVSPNKLLSGQGCPKCSKYSSKKDYAWLKNLVESTNEYLLISKEYKNTKTKVQIKHTICSNTFEMRPEDFANGQRCPNCAKKLRALHKTKPDNIFKKEVFDLVDDEYKVLGVYKSNSDKIEFKHEICGNKFLMTPENFLHGNRCPFCAGNQLKTTDEFKKEISELDNGNEYEVLSEYIGNTKYIKMKHSKCNNEFNVFPNNFLHGTRCPYCAYKEGSKKEKEVLNFIKENYNGEVIEHYRLQDSKNNKKTAFKEADIYLPELKIGIEFNGLYFHSERSGKDKNYHLDKTNFFKNAKIRLIQIFEDEWTYKQDIVKRKLLHILKLDNKEKIYARKCIVKEVNFLEANNFLNKYHIQGEDKSKIRLGLYYNNELVAIMTFAKLRAALGRKSISNEYELSRFAGKNVIGGFSKLLKYTINNYNITKIITYADLRWSSEDSNVYEKNGFKLIGKSKPNYWYVKMNGKCIREHRYSYRKQALKKKFPEIYNDNKTEKQIMNEAKYDTVWDCGNLVFEYTK